MLRFQQEGSSKTGKDSDAFTAQQLRTLFVPSYDTPCETHDQLQCGCKSGARYVLEGDEQDAAVEPATIITSLDDTDSDDDLPDLKTAFVKASQYTIPKAKVSCADDVKPLP